MSLHYFKFAQTVLVKKNKPYKPFGDNVNWQKTPISTIPDGDLHVMPDKDIFPHVENVSCPCVPAWNDYNKRQYRIGLESNRVIVHNRHTEKPH